MDGQPATAESTHRYQPQHWSLPPSNSASARAKPTSSSETPSIPLATQFDLCTILYTQEVVHQQDKILQYSKLISGSRSGGSGLHTPPLPPVLTTPQTKSTTRSRSSSKVSNKDNAQPKSSAQSCHGNRPAKTSETAERALMKLGKDQSSSKMSANNTNTTSNNHNSSNSSSNNSTNKKPPEPSLTRELPVRLPPSASQSSSFQSIHSSSVPSTPHQHPKKCPCESRDPSPGATHNHSPRSAYSETNGNVPSLRPLPQRYAGCPFETAIPHSRRRMPYSLGTDRLEKVDLSKVKSKLTEEEEQRLNADLLKLYKQLLPTKPIEGNRKKLVAKLEKLFNDKWPGRDIKVHLFGSSGNNTCSDDSDVDICITTPWRELENVCMIAELLHQHGMEKVVCVSSAKVPIVKIWDPELKLACDMNVNNTLALENTRMVRTYVDIDERVRQLAMIVKYWTRRRIVNDAAFGGTLSSYTWICMVIAFLQLRDPPVLPALHQCDGLRLPRDDNTRSEFADDVEALQERFGDKNKESLASLLFNFFRFYAHEFDYDKYVLSIRMGKLLTKTEKKWHIGSNNMLCVEEPFNTVRNLGNTADDTSFRGLHMELRRAFELISEGKFEECCEQYVFPKEEERTYIKPPTISRPVLLRSSSQQAHSTRGGRGGYRGNRQFGRNGSGGRRASSGVQYEPNPTFLQTALANPLSPQDLLWYQAQSPQLTVPQDIIATSFGQIPAHQAAQEIMRFQLYTSINQQQQVLAQAQRLQTGSATDRARTNSFDNPPLTAPVRPELVYPFTVPVQPSAYFHPGFTTYPSSPATTATAPSANGQAAEYRRSLHRNAGTSDSGSSPGSGALRSQSQPASRTPMVISQPLSQYSTSGQSQNGATSSQMRQLNGMTVPSFVPDEAGDGEMEGGATPRVLSDSPPEDDGPRYIGYYVNEHASPNRQANGFPSSSGATLSAPISQSSQARRRRLSTDQLPQSVLDRRMKRTSRSPSPMGHTRAISVGMSSAPLPSAPFGQAGGEKPSSKPVVVNGSVPASSSALASRRPPQAPDAHASEDGGHHDNANALHIQHSMSPSSWSEQQPSAPLSNTEPAAVPPPPDRPVIVNGSSTNRSPAAVPSLLDATFQQRMAMGVPLHLPYSAVVGDPNGSLVGFARLHTRQQLAPLDLATQDFGVHQEIPHLSPVYEHRTPSPTVSRKSEPSPGTQSPGSGSHKENRSDFSKQSQKAPVNKSPTSSSSNRQLNDSANRSPVQDQRVNGVAKENGHTRTTRNHSENAGGWQRSKQRKKVGGGDSKHLVNGSSHSEQPPKNEADRKGG